MRVQLPFRGSYSSRPKRAVEVPLLLSESAALMDGDELLRLGLAADTSACLLAGPGDCRVLAAHPDSGARHSMTPYAEALANTRPCCEVYVSASGERARATLIGDMPVVAKADDGRLVSFVLRNVRCVPAFKYTLLSVTQLWREQRVDVRFADTNALVLPPSSGGHVVPFATGNALPTVMLRSEADAPQPMQQPATDVPRPTKQQSSAADSSLSLKQLARLLIADGPDGPAADAALAEAVTDLLAAIADDDGSGSDAARTGGRSTRHLGFHRVGANSHVAKLSAAQASELLHRRSHLGARSLLAAPLVGLPVVHLLVHLQAPLTRATGRCGRRGRGGWGRAGRGRGRGVEYRRAVHVLGVEGGGPGFGGEGSRRGGEEARAGGGDGGAVGGGGSVEGRKFAVRAGAAARCHALCTRWVGGRIVELFERRATPRRRRSVWCALACATLAQKMAKRTCRGRGGHCGAVQKGKRAGPVGLEARCLVVAG